MSRIARAFNEKAKIAYLTAGDGKNSYEYFLALEEAGVNILEIGIPFSDPVADGPTIQLAMERSIQNGTNLNSIFDIIKQIRIKSEIAIVLFTYYNLIQKNLAEFLQKAKQSGADGILVVDLPIEEACEFRFLCKKYQLDAIMVASPSTSLERIESLTTYGSGFLYYACFKGTTGIRDELPNDLIEKVSAMKQYSKLPIAIGFGVSNNKMVKQILNIADGCVIGSYLVKLIESNYNLEEFKNLAKEVFKC